ncbi:hypothetical protein [Sporosarcina sp. G11-34]|nr:hypothetical protein [Sporosarcina sp. G11-34]MCZ2258683.1 hypothetical protein [Sporosarcina sp. G11-34]
MTKLEKEVLRMEMQVSELIRMVANLNERIKEIEDKKQLNRHIQTII